MAWHELGLFGQAIPAWLVGVVLAVIGIGMLLILLILALI